MVKVPYAGRMVEAEEVDFLTRREEWNEYQLTDGTIMKMKVVPVRAYKVVGEKDKEGSQVYQVKSHTIMDIRGVE